MPQRLAQHLISKSLVPAAGVDGALRRMQRDGGSLDTALLEASLISEAGILQALSDVSGVRLVNLADFEPNAEAGPLMPLKMARQLGCVPLSLDGKALHVACGYPMPAAQLKDVGFLLGRTLELWVAVECRVRDWQHVLYGAPLEPRYERILYALDPTRPKPAAAPIEAPKTEVVPVPKSEPILLDRPKTKAAKPSTKDTAPELEVVAVGDSGSLGEAISLADAAPMHTSVIDVTAYSRFAKAGENDGGVPLDEHESTRVLDIGAYANFAKQVTPHASTSGSIAALSFPGGVLPPKPSVPPVAAAKAVEPGLVQPASTTRAAPSSASSPSGVRTTVPPAVADPARKSPTANKAVPRISAPTVSVPRDEAVTVSAPAPAPARSAPPPARPSVVKQQPLPRTPTAELPMVTASLGDEADFSDVQISGEHQVPLDVEPGPTPPPPPVASASDESDSELPTPPEAPSQELAPAPAPRPEPQVPVTWQAEGALLSSPPGLAPSNAMEWTLAQARASLKEATFDREQLISVVLDYARRTFEYVAAFAVVRGAAYGWDCRGDGDAEVLRQVGVPLDATSVFRTVALTRGSYVGPLPPDSLSQYYLGLLGRAPRTVFMWPVEVQSKLVAILYGDCGARPVSQRRLADFILFCQDLPGAFHDLILARRNAVVQAAQVESAPALQYVEAPSTPEAPADADWFSGLISLLTGPDPAERTNAMVELMKTPYASARALAHAFPGPTGWSRLPVVDLPEPDELGPIPGALARLGEPGALALAPLLDTQDSDTRYLALLSAGSMRFPSVIDGVIRGIFDFEPDISSAARAAAAALRPLPQFGLRMNSLRQELNATDPLRRSLAARALGVLHDRDAIDGLINVVGSEDQMCSAAAADALREITRAPFGTQAKAWTAWWARERGRRRVEWLVDALNADDFDLRLSAIEELSRAFGDSANYFADAGPAERAQSQATWRAFIAEHADLDL